MPQPSQRIQRIPFSPIRAMFRLADEMERAGRGPVIRFHVGDPDFAPPDAVIEATHRAMREGRTHYPPSVGVHELRLALAGKVAERNGIAGTWMGTPTTSSGMPSTACPACNASSRTCSSTRA